MKKSPIIGTVRNSAISLAAIALLVLMGTLAVRSGAEEHEHPEDENVERRDAGDAHDEHGDFDNDENQGEEHGHDGEDELGCVELTEEEMDEFGISLQMAGSGVIESSIRFPGEIRPNGDRIAHIAPRYSGIVLDVKTRLGDNVRKGDVLAIVESDESLTRFEVRTMIGGTIVEKHAVPGEVVTEDEAIYVVADLNTVWAEISIDPKALRLVRRGQSVRIHPFVIGEFAVGAIDYVSPFTDEETRTGTARVVLSNSDGKWRPGSFVTGEIVIGREEANLVVPVTALQFLDDGPVVFVRTDHGFEPRHVEIGHRGEWDVEILSGLSTGERFVSRGGFLLKADLGKGSFGDGHAH